MKKSKKFVNCEKASLTAPELHQNACAQRLSKQMHRDSLLFVMAEIFVVGSASGFPAPGRGHSSLLLSLADQSILIDAGEPCSRSLAEAGISFSTIDSVLLTHGHADHTGGLPMLIQSLWLSQRAKPLPLFLPEELTEPLR